MIRLRVFAFLMLFGVFGTMVGVVAIGLAGAGAAGDEVVEGQPATLGAGRNYVSTGGRTTCEIDRAGDVDTFEMGRTSGRTRRGSEFVDGPGTLMCDREVELTRELNLALRYKDDPIALAVPIGALAVGVVGVLVMTAKARRMAAARPELLDDGHPEVGRPPWA